MRRQLALQRPLNRPLNIVLPDPMPLDPAQNGKHCAFCEGRYLDTPPEKSRVIRLPDGAWETRYRTPAEELDATVAEFRPAPMRGARSGTEDEEKEKASRDHGVLRWAAVTQTPARAWRRPEAAAPKWTFLRERTGRWDHVPRSGQVACGTVQGVDSNPRLPGSDASLTEDADLQSHARPDEQPSGSAGVVRSPRNPPFQLLLHEATHPARRR